MRAIRGNAQTGPSCFVVVCMTLSLVCSLPVFAEVNTARLYKQLRESVVTLYPMGPSGSPLGSASGVVVGDGRTILTNYHAVAGAKSVLVAAETATGQEWRTATIHETAPDQDLASIRFEDGTSLKAARLASKLPEVGTSVLAIGSPLGFSGTLSTGIVSQVHKGDDTTMIQTTAPISPGISGGGLFTESSELIAITSMYLLQGQQLNFAVYVGESSRLRPYVETATPIPGSPESRAELDSVYVAGIELRLGDPKEKVLSYFEVPRSDGISMKEITGSDDEWVIEKVPSQENSDLYAIIGFRNNLLSFIGKHHETDSTLGTVDKFFALVEKYSTNVTASPTIRIQKWGGGESLVKPTTCVSLSFGARNGISFWYSLDGSVGLQENLMDK